MFHIPLTHRFFAHLGPLFIQATDHRQLSLAHGIFRLRLELARLQLGALGLLQLRVLAGEFGGCRFQPRLPVLLRRSAGFGHHLRPLLLQAPRDRQFQLALLFLGLLLQLTCFQLRALGLTQPGVLGVDVRLERLELRFPLLRSGCLSDLDGALLLRIHTALDFQIHRRPLLLQLLAILAHSQFLCLCILEQLRRLRRLRLGSLDLAGSLNLRGIARLLANGLDLGVEPPGDFSLGLVPFVLQQRRGQRLGQLERFPAVRALDVQLIVGHGYHLER